MRVALFFIGILISFSALSKEKEWRFGASETMCSIQNYDSVNINDNEIAQFSISFGIASESHKLVDSFQAIGLKPNKYILQISVSIHHHKDDYKLFDTEEINIPTQVEINNIFLEAHEADYGKVYYLHNEKVKGILEKLSKQEPFQFNIHVGNIDTPIPVTIAKKWFGLHYHLLKSCAEYFVSSK